MIRALGKTMTLRPGEQLSKHDFYLPLSDVLLDLVEKDPNSPDAADPAQLGCSFAHDFVNLATIAGQLLWLVDVAPVRTGTPDSLSISMLAEAYLMQLRAACDVIAVIIHTFCLDEEKKGKCLTSLLMTYSDGPSARVAKRNHQDYPTASNSFQNIRAGSANLEIFAIS